MSGIKNISTPLRPASHLGAFGWCLYNFDKRKYRAGTGSPSGLKCDITDNSTVTFTLSLHGKRRDHQLSVSVDGSEALLLFSGAELTGDGSGFVPAVSLFGDSSVRFLGFE